MEPPSHRRLVPFGVLLLVAFVSAWPFLRPGARAAPPPQSGVTPTPVVYLPFIQSNGAASTATPTPTFTSTSTPTPTTTTTSTPTPGAGTITGIVWNDVDGDGDLDATESGLGGPGGIHIALEDLAFNKIAETVTDVSSGAYTFASVPPGNYYVVETDRVGYQSTTANIVSLFLTANTTVLVYFGDQQTPTPTPTATSTITPTPTPSVGTITGIVWSDADGDGAKGSAESGLEGVKISLKNSEFVEVLPATYTLSYGYYSFSEVPPGNYYVVETDPSGYTSTTPNTISIYILANTTYELSFGDHQ